MINIFVTGGAGYIGSHICKTLNLNGYIPVTLDNLSRGHQELVKWGPLEIGDVADENWLCEIMQKYQPAAVIHCAGFISVAESVNNPELYYKNNLATSISLLKAMVKENVKKIIFSSSCAVHGDPQKIPIQENDSCIPNTPYGHTKLLVEQTIQNYSKNLSYVNLRYFNAAGADPECETGELHQPETHAIPLAIDASINQTEFSLFGTDYATPDGTALRDYIHVTDLAQAHLLALNYLNDGKESCTINVGTGVGISVRDLIKTISQITKKNLLVKEMPRRNGDAPELIANPNRAKELLGFFPEFSDIETIVKTAFEWHRNINKFSL